MVLPRTFFLDLGIDVVPAKLKHEQPRPLFGGPTWPLCDDHIK
jgi:hypothetical protein